MWDVAGAGAERAGERAEAGGQEVAPPVARTKRARGEVSDDDEGDDDDDDNRVGAGAAA